MTRRGKLNQGSFRFSYS